MSIPGLSSLIIIPKALENDSDDEGVRMIGVRYHLSEDGPRLCTASVKDCPVKGAHFTSKEDAATAFEFKAKVIHQPFRLFKKRPQVVDPHVKHITVAEQLISEREDELKERDLRQQNDTLFHQLKKEGFTQELLKERFLEEAKTRKITIGYGKADEGESPVVGIVYGGDYRAEEEEGIRIISKALAEGSYEPESVQVYEKDGVTLLAIRGKDSYVFNTGSDLDVLVKPEAEVLERFKKQTEDSQFERRWELEQKSFPDLKIEGAHIKPAPRSKEGLISAILAHEKKDNERLSGLGEFQNGRALVLATTDPLEAKVFRKLKDAHDGGHLRVGGPANPYGRGSLFYDDRDLSGRSKRDQIRAEEASRYSLAYISETRERMERMHGKLYTIEPRVDSTTADVRDVSYWVDWDVTGGKRVTGLYTKEQLERMTTGNFSEVD